MNISVCIATYRRPERLCALLEDLVSQQRLPKEVVVVDNDAAGSARAVVERRRESGAPFPIRYDVQPVKNISLTRNRTVALASGDWIAFIDDDERAPAAWLQQLAETVIRFTAPTARSVRSCRSYPPMRRHGSGAVASMTGRGCKPAPSSLSTSCASATCCCAGALLRDTPDALRSALRPDRRRRRRSARPSGPARRAHRLVRRSHRARAGRSAHACRCAGCCCGHCAADRTLRATS